MGTEVLYPQDVLLQRLRPAPAAFLPRRKPHRAAPAAATNPNPNTNTNFNTNNLLHRYGTAAAAAAANFSGSGRISCANPRSPPRKPEAARRKREASPKAGGAAQPLVMGQVTILKRGESLDGKTSRSLLEEGKKKKKAASGGGGGEGIVSSVECGDLIVFGTGPLGPDPRMVPRLADLKAAGAVYAGSGFSSFSPSPDDLPMPNFTLRKEMCPAAVDLSATNGLLRLLRLG